MEEGVKSRTSTRTATRVKHVLQAVYGVPEVGVLIPFIILVLLFSYIQNDFSNINNITSILKGMSFYAMVSIGITMVILLGHIDISVGQVAGFSTTFSMMLIMNYHVPIVAALILDLGVCAFVRVHCRIFRYTAQPVSVHRNHWHVLHRTGSQILSHERISNLPDSKGSR